MSMRFTPEEEIDLIQPTVGWEGELKEITFILIQNNKITLSENDAVLSIFKKTEHGVSGENDDMEYAGFLSKLEKIADEEGYTLNTFSNAVHIFEFITSPTNNYNDISTQFAEVARLQLDLIQYLFNLKKHNPDMKLVCINEWIKDYNTNRRSPHKPLVASSQANEMYIVVDDSIERIIKSVNSKTLDLPNGFQKHLKHHVQFNFVASLGKKMGSMLAEIYEANNTTNAIKEDVVALEKEMADEIMKLKAIGKTNDEINYFRIKFQEKINIKKEFIDRREKRKNILYRAENNAEIACQFLREKITLLNHDEKKEHKQNRKFVKLEGFFFLLSMRILTETSRVFVTNSSPKNMYLFFLKTQLSDLVHCLSMQDKALLQDLEKWPMADKDKLLAHIAGSAEALTVSYKIGAENFTIKDVLESALGWTQNKMCDKLPGASIKKIDPAPVEPVTTQIRSKNLNYPLRRVLLEFRASQNQNIFESEREMENILRCSAKFCKTSYIHKKEGTFMQHQNAEVKQIHSEYFIEENVDNAIKFISQYVPFPKKPSELFVAVKNELNSILSHEDPDITLKQINYLYIKLKSSDSSINQVIFDLYSEKIFDLFRPPLKEIDDKYIGYIMQRYALTNKIPQVVAFLNSNSRANVPGPGQQYSGLFSHAEEKLININEFRSRLEDALGKYTEADKLKRKAKITALISLAPELMNKNEVYDLLHSINQELNRVSFFGGGKSVVLRNLLNPLLRDMLFSLKIEDNKNLESAFSSDRQKTLGKSPG